MKLVLVQPDLSYEVGDGNLDAIRRTLAPAGGTLTAEDVVLLPEHFDLRPSREQYERSIADLSTWLGCHVVGGSHHEARDGSVVNSGIVANASGAVVGSYEKLRPYAAERNRVNDGTVLGEITLGGLSVLVLICADFWFSDVFYRCRKAPDVVLVPALSVTRKPTPHYSRALWEHLAVSRAYEFGAYVGISDWAYRAWPLGVAPSGVSGFADPTTVEAEALFSRTHGDLAVHELDLGALAAFRRDRMERGFFWKAPADAG